MCECFSLGKQSLSDCVPCEAGYYCLESGNNTVTGKCAPGYYCVDKAWEPTPTGNVVKLLSLPGVCSVHGQVACADIDTSVPFSLTVYLYWNIYKVKKCLLCVILLVEIKINTKNMPPKKL